MLVTTVPPASIHCASASDMHALPSKQRSSGHEQTRVSSLNSGLQPHGPRAQAGGKSPTPSQQFAVDTVPPDSMQSALTSSIALVPVIVVVVLISATVLVVASTSITVEAVSDGGACVVDGGT